MASAIEVHQRLIATFPKLAETAYEVTSQPTSVYNCIAWAAGEDSCFMWPGIFWPKDVPSKVTRVAFIKAFVERGYVQCDGPELEEGFEKVCLYEKLGRPTHAARQLPNGTWTSKLGNEHDISHELDGLTGKVYGHPAVYLRRPTPVE
jgi:hypothetical protein